MTPAPGWFARHFLQAPVPVWATPAWTVVTIVSALARAQDYLVRGSEPAGRGLTTGVQELGLVTWGWGFALLVAALVAALLLLATPWRWRWPLVVVHTAGVGLFVAYAIALADGIADSGRGWFLLLLPVANAAAHLLCAVLYVPGVPRPPAARK